MTGKRFVPFLSTVVLTLACSKPSPPPQNAPAAKPNLAAGTKRLEIVFTGIIAYGPSNGGRTGDAADDVVLLLPDGRTARKSRNFPKTESIPAHVPFLAFNPDDYDGGRSDFQAEYGWNVITLNREDLSFKGDPATKVTFADPDVVRLTEVCKVGRATPNELGATPAHAIARVVLKSGAISETSKTKCEFTLAACPGDKGRSQGVMANEVKWSVDLPAETRSVEIDAQPFDGGAVKQLKLKFGKSNTSSVISLRLGNVQQEEIKPWLEADPRKGESMLHVVDFELYYDLSDQELGTQPIPIKADPNCSPVMKRPGTDFCPPVAY